MHLLQQLRNLIPSDNITFSAGELKFERGQDLMDWIQKDKLNLDIDNEVNQ